MTFILQLVTLIYALGTNLDIRKIAVFIVGVILIVTGNYLPKFDTVNHLKVDTEKARKINRFLGYETVIMGAIFLLSIFLPPIFSIIALILLIPYSILGFVYSIITARK